MNLNTFKNRLTLATITTLLLVLSACGQPVVLVPSTQPTPIPSPVVVERESVTPTEGYRKSGSPYTISGITYYPQKSAEGYVAEGIASWYGKQFHGGLTANGERFDMYAISAAHTTLPLPTQVRVTNLENGRWTVLRVNDRGPFVKDRLIDLSYAAAKELGYAEKGTTRVRVEVLGPSDLSSNGFAAKPIKLAEQKKTRLVDPPITKPAVVKPPVIKPRVAKTVATHLKSTQTTKPKSKSGKRQLFIQAGSFRDRSNAERLSRRLKKSSKVRILSSTVGKQTYYRVLFGPFANYAIADKMVKKLSRLDVKKPRIVLE